MRSALGGIRRAGRMIIGRLAVLAVAALAVWIAGGGAAQAQDRPAITVAVDNLWPTMDPVIGISTTGARVHWNLFDTLARRNFHEDEFGRTLQPHLATGWERTSPTVWTVTLRQGVTFHDGHPPS